MIQLIVLTLLSLVALPYAVFGQTTGFYAIQGGTFKDLQKATKKTESDLVISEITFKVKSPGKETVWIQGNRSSKRYRSSQFFYKADDLYAVEVEGE
jgi:hypothetical protein